MDRRKELKLAYKQTPPSMGVYQIKNNINNKIFIGSSMNLHGKKNSYQLQLNTNTHSNKELQTDWGKYDPDAFSFDILETIRADELSKDDWREAVSALEEKWLYTLQPYEEQGYNKRKKRKRDIIIVKN